MFCDGAQSGFMLLYRLDGDPATKQRDNLTKNTASDFEPVIVFNNMKIGFTWDQTVAANAKMIDLFAIEICAINIRQPSPSPFFRTPGF